MPDILTLECAGSEKASATLSYFTILLIQNTSRLLHRACEKANATLTVHTHIHDAAGTSPLPSPARLPRYLFLPSLGLLGAHVPSFSLTLMCHTGASRPPGSASSLSAPLPGIRRTARPPSSSSLRCVAKGTKHQVQPVALRLLLPCLEVGPGAITTAAGGGIMPSAAASSGCTGAAPGVSPSS